MTSTGVVAESDRGRGKTRARFGSIRYIPGLDGLRALAVLGVMADHGGISFLQGGFLGVDAFFVLSGFLITSLLVSEWDRRSGIALGAFWVRRARRLLAGLLLMVLAVAVYVRFFVVPGTYPTLRLDALAAVFYVANWHFILSGQNYFNQVGPPSLLQHTWSLAIEEQFYLVWPLLVLGLAKLRRSVWPLLIVSVVGALASAIEMALLFHPGMDTTRLYFGTDTQAQCLLVGAALACVLVLWSRQRDADRGTERREEQAEERWYPGFDKRQPFRQAATPRGRALLLSGGVVGLAVSIFTWSHLNGNDGTGFGGLLFRGGFLIAAMATALVVVSVVCFQKGPMARALSVRPLRYLGRISYGLYLWHFPIFQMLDAGRVHLVGDGLFVVRFAVAFAVSVASYHLVELPVRRGMLFKQWRGWLTTPVAVSSAIIILVAATSVPAASAAAQTAASAVPAGFQASAGTPTRVLMVGDSTADTLSVGLEEVESQYNVDISDEANDGCGIAITQTRQVENYMLPSYPACSLDPPAGEEQWPALWKQEIAAFDPNVVVLLTGRWEVSKTMWEGHWVTIGQPAFDAYLESMLEKAVHVATAQGAHLVLLTAPYYDTGEQPNGKPWPEDDPTRVFLFDELLWEVADANPSTVTLINLNAMVSPGNAFARVIDGEVVRGPDGIHFTAAAGEWLAPKLLPEIVDSTAAPRTAVPAAAG